MLIAPDFVFVHLSKTGGTFAAETIKEVLCPSPVGRRLHRIKTRQRVSLPFYRYRYYEIADQHSQCNEIPKEQSDKTILSIIRNPFDLYLSEYTFNWWKKYPRLWFHDLAEVERRCPNWQDLSFEEFFDFSNEYAEWVCKATIKYPQTRSLGWYSHKFIHYYCREPEYVFEAAGDFDLLLQRVRESIYPVAFLHTERLNDDLFRFFSSRGYDRDRIEFISTKAKINRSRETRDTIGFYSETLRKRISEQDALIFELFPEYRR